MTDSNVRYRVFIRNSTPYVGVRWSYQEAEALLRHEIDRYNAPGGYIEKIERVFELPAPLKKPVMVRVVRKDGKVEEDHFLDWYAAEAFAGTKRNYESIEISDKYTSVINSEEH
ncbi:hypothetical protein IH601_08885, partial [Candidatus Bipolaricaulota bacterium]|nr:hypothetical protein [Candidatus Bipolaricaulota bacterium]